MIRICFHRRKTSGKKPEFPPNHYEKCCETFNLMPDGCQFWGEEVCHLNLNLSSSPQAIRSSISTAMQISTDAIEYTSKFQNKSINKKKFFTVYSVLGTQTTSSSKLWEPNPKLTEITEDQTVILSRLQHQTLETSIKKHKNVFK